MGEYEGYSYDIGLMAIEVGLKDPGRQWEWMYFQWQAIESFADKFHYYPENLTLMPKQTLERVYKAADKTLNVIQEHKKEGVKDSCHYENISDADVMGEDFFFDTIIPRANAWCDKFFYQFKELERVRPWVRLAWQIEALIGMSGCFAKSSKRFLTTAEAYLIHDTAVRIENFAKERFAQYRWPIFIGHKQYGHYEVPQDFCGWSSLTEGQADKLGVQFFRKVDKAFQEKNVHNTAEGE